MGGSQRELLELLTAAIERQPVGVFIVRFDAGNPLRPPIVYANEAFCTLTGYTKDEIANGTYPTIVGPLTDRELIASQARLVAGGQNVVTELMLYHRDATPFFAEVRAHPIDAPVRHH
jgi:PAS domain S-box-containing protein